MWKVSNYQSWPKITIECFINIWPTTKREGQYGMVY